MFSANIEKFVRAAFFRAPRDGCFLLFIVNICCLNFKSTNVFYWLKWWKFTKQIHNQEETHLIYYSNSTSFWIESGELCLIFEKMLFHGEVPWSISVRLLLKLATCLLDWCYQSSFLRLFVQMFTMLNINNNSRKIK